MQVYAQYPFVLAMKKFYFYSVIKTSFLSFSPSLSLSLSLSHSLPLFLSLCLSLFLLRRLLRGWHSLRRYLRDSARDRVSLSGIFALALVFLLIIVPFLLSSHIPFSYECRRSRIIIHHIPPHLTSTCFINILT